MRIDTVTEARLAVREFDHARDWIAQQRAGPVPPLGVEVWLFDEDLRRVLLVNHPWRGWVPPGGRVEPGETMREAASRELFEETGLRVELDGLPAAAAVRSYRAGSAPTLGLSYAAVADAGRALSPEDGQPAAWTPLDQDWATYFPDDPDRIRWHARWLANR